MSPLLHDRLRVFVGESHLSVIRWKRGLRARIAHRAVRAIEHPSGWHHALEALHDCLQQLPSASEPRCDVILSNRFARFLLVKPGEHIETKEEAFSLAQHRMRTVFGERARHLEVRCSFEGPGVPYIASGIDRSLHERLNELVSQHGKLETLQPYLMPVFNRARSALLQSSCWLVVWEPSVTLVALLVESRWMHLAVHYSTASDAESLLSLLEAETLRSGYTGPIPHVALQANGLPELGTLALRGYKLIELSPKGKSSAEGNGAEPDWRLQMALLGAPQ